MDYLQSDDARQDGPFDLVVIDADKDGIWNYWCALQNGLLSERATVVLDTTPYKGQPPDRYVKFGMDERWESNSGQAAIQEAMNKFKQDDSKRMATFAGVTVMYPK